MFARGERMRISDPPDDKRKTAGRAGTLLSGNIYSVAAISYIYDIIDSSASVKCAGGEA
jgi:hypothetical protein